MRPSSFKTFCVMAGLALLGWPFAALGPTNAAAQDNNAAPAPITVPSSSPTSTPGSLSGGEPAFMAPLASQALILDAIFHDDMIIAVGDRGHILRSRDQGQSWEQSPVPVSIPLTAINKAAQDRLIVAGHDAVIMVSDDQGASWAIVHREPDWEQPILDLFFITPDRGLALGAYGLVLETTDGGASWAERTLFDGDSHLYASTRLPSGDLLIAGEFGTLLRSQDDGETWDELDSPYGGTFFGIATPTVSQPDEPLLVFGLQGNVFASNDNGDSWTPIATDIPNGLYDAVRTDDGRAVLLGHGGMILVDRDPSPGFDWASIIRPARKPLAGALPLEDGRFLIYGETGVEILRVEATP